MGLVLDTDYRNTAKFIKNLDIFEEGPSWGGFESLINSPGITDNEEYLSFTTIPQGLLRISVGLEDVDSILEDLDQSLKKL